jgi:hypothetical protein
MNQEPKEKETYVSFELDSSGKIDEETLKVHHSSSSARDAAIEQIKQYPDKKIKIFQLRDIMEGKVEIVEHSFNSKEKGVEG